MTSNVEQQTVPEQAITPSPSSDSCTNSTTTTTTTTTTTNADNMRHDDTRSLNTKRSSPKPPILPGWTWSRFVLLLVDNALCGLLIGPLTVFYWRGTWRLLDYNLVPDIQNRSSTTSDDSGWSLTSAPSTLSGWICMVIGNVGLIALVYCQRLLDRWIKVEKFVHWLIGFHLYTYVMGFLNVLHWRGVWLLLDQYTGIGLVSAAVTAAIGQGGLWLLRSSRNASAPPMVVVIDAQQGLFAYSTRFNTQLIVFYWRGSWEVLDNLLFPNDQTSSAVASLVIGYALHLILCIIQPLFNVLYLKTSADSQGNDADVGSSCSGSAVLRWFLEVVFFFISNLICVFHWRGIWLLLDVYVLPGLPNASAGLTHAVGIFTLWLLGAGHSVTLAGCQVEGDARPEEGCLTKNEYVRHFVERHRSRLLNIEHEESHSDDKAKESCSGISCCL